MRTAQCPICGKEFEDPEDRPHQLRGSAEQRLERHLALSGDAEHVAARGETVPDPQFSEDEPPQPKKAQATKKQAPKRAAAPKGGVLPLAVQLQLPYQLLGNALANRLPATANALYVNAGPAAEAWDRFLMRYPAIREKIENGLIGADVLALVMVHVEILRVAREEIQFQAQAEQHYEGGLQPNAA